MGGGALQSRERVRGLQLALETCAGPTTRQLRGLE